MMKIYAIKTLKRIAVSCYFLAWVLPAMGSFDDALWGFQCFIIGAMEVKSIPGDGSLVFLSWLPNLLFLTSLIFKNRPLRLVFTALAVVLGLIFPLILLQGESPAIGFYIWELSFIIWHLANWQEKRDIERHQS